MVNWRSFFFLFFQGISPCGMLDFTNPETARWVENQTRSLLEGLEMDPSFLKQSPELKLPNIAFHLDTGSLENVPHYFQFHQRLSNPDVARDSFVQAVMKHIPVVGVSGVSEQRPKAPAYIFLQPVTSSWQGLRSTLANVLHLSVVGYPFVNPGPVGGSSAASLELYVRWWQLSTFMPILHFTNPPSSLPFDKVCLKSTPFFQNRQQTLCILGKL